MRSQIIGAACAVILPATAALAAGGQPRAWVSGPGLDAASCGAIASPCRTLQYAHDNIVAPGGSIYVKGPANYGQIVIRQAISIINDGSGTATILAPSGIAVAVQAGANDAVLIRGMTLDGAGTGAGGVLLTSGLELVIADCVIQSFRKAGLSAGLAIQTNSGLTNFLVERTTIAGNGTFGVYVVPDSVNAAFGTIRGSSISGGVFGVYVSGPLVGAARVTIADVTIQSPSQEGLEADGTAFLRAKRVHIDGVAGDGVLAKSAAIVELSDSGFSNNIVDIGNIGGSSQVVSYGDNSYATHSGVVTPRAKQ